MNVIVFVVIGIIMGGLARLLVLRGAPGGWPLALLIGTAGSMFAAFLAQTFVGRMAGDPVFSIIAAVIGAAVLLLCYRLDISRTQGRATSHGLKMNR